MHVICHNAALVDEHLPDTDQGVGGSARFAIPPPARPMSQEHVASALNDKMQAASEDAPIRSMQPAETAALLQAMQARINALEGQLGETRKKLEETRKGLQEAERRRVADSRELRGRVEKGEKEVMNVKAELLVVKWEMEGSLEATKEELEGKLGESKEEQEGNIVTAKKELEGGLIEVKGELIAMKGELVTVKRQLHEDGAEKVGKEGVDVQVEVAVSWRSAAAEQGQSSTHEELAVGEQLRKSQGDVSSAWQKIRAAATLDLKGQAHLSDALLAHVATMTHLKHVHIDMTSGFTSQGIKCLYSLPHLESLELKGTTVTASTLEGIGAASSSLKLLYLNQAAVTDAGLPHLTALAFLKTLILYKCEGVTCPGMVLVGRMTSLEELYLFGSGVKNHGLRFLAPLTRLKMLVLPSSITDAGLEHLQQLVALELLDVSNSVVRKKGVKLLKGLPRLKQVRAGSASLQLLRTALPGVVVSKDLLPGTISGDVS
ncbi:unnamed protein product [Closterium sp. Yama58-4]|nr:unnamed protein product [Closterium sp. Yama58-4]